MWNIKKKNQKKILPLPSLKKKKKRGERERLFKMVGYLHAVIKIIWAEFEVIVMVEIFFSEV